MESVRVSVRELVEFVFKEGSIDSRFQARSSLTIGTKLHQKLQKQYKDEDEKEVFLQGDFLVESILYKLEGRCDGLLYQSDEVVIEEIKSTAKSLEDIEEGARVHWAQGQCYAYLLAKEKQLNRVKVKLTYIQIDTEDTKSFLKSYSFLEIEEIVGDILAAYSPFTNVLIDNKKKKLQSIPAISFPYPAFRKGQKELAGAVYKTIIESKSLFANAPTGTGKTISTLFPAIKGMEEESPRQWFYVTAKTITRTVAEEALFLLEKEGMEQTAVTITAKDKICFQEETICQKEYCEFADGYYDRINGALIDILSCETIMTRPIIETYALKHRVCPFEFSIDLAYIVDGVICDYNYVFDPRVSLKRMSEDKKKRTVLLVDEAHNLVGRGRDMFSAHLKKTAFLEVKRIHSENQALKKAINKINKHFLRLKKEGDTRIENDKELVTELEEFVESVEKWLGEGSQEWSPEFLQLYFDALSFIRISKLYSNEHRFVIESSSRDMTVKLFCIDPSKLIQNVTKSYHSTVFFLCNASPIFLLFSTIGGTRPGLSFSHSIPI